MPTILKSFISKAQLSVMNNICAGEEGEFMLQKMQELCLTITTMPKTYQTDGQGPDAIVHLHYFHGGMDWYITERDQEPEQSQAFGLANLGYGGELGYISIAELIENNIEIDLYWTPKKLSEIDS
jgi:hypothetical protein